jgi:hypothetical protein
LIRFAVKSGDPAAELQERAEKADAVTPGTVLLANPAAFCSEFAPRNGKVSPQLLSKFGLTVPPPADLGPDRRADLLPVLMVVETVDNTVRSVLLNRRMGYLLGDLEQPDGTPVLEKYCIQPLWFGGIDTAT